MKNYLKEILGFLTLVVISSVSVAQTNPAGGSYEGNPIQTAVPFLRISPEARAGGMGDAAVAVTPDANAIFWNSAKLPFTSTDAGVILAYTPWLDGLDIDDIHLINAGGFIKTNDDMGAFNLALRYFSLGETYFRNDPYSVPVVANPQEYAIQGGYSRKLGETTALGVNLKYIHSDLAQGYSSGAGQTFEAGQAVAGDLNFYFDPVNTGSADWSFGTSLSNLGSKISYVQNSAQKDFLPTNLGLGTNVDLALDDVNHLNFALDVNKLLVPTPESINDSNFKNTGVIEGLFTSWTDAPGGFSEEMQEFQISFGTEYNYDDKFYGRAGYFYENPDKGARQYVTMGVGAEIEKLAEIDFAYMFATNNSNSPLDGTMRFSLNFDINK